MFGEAWPQKKQSRTGYWTFLIGAIMKKVVLGNIPFPVLHCRFLMGADGSILSHGMEPPFFLNMSILESINHWTKLHQLSRNPHLLVLSLFVLSKILIRFFMNGNFAGNTYISCWRNPWFPEFPPTTMPMTTPWCEQDLASAASGLQDGFEEVRISAHWEKLLGHQGTWQEKNWVSYEFER